jgi:hypothetical protein
MNFAATALASATAPYDLDQLLSSLVPENPNRVPCPLCRRVHTVRLESVSPKDKYSNFSTFSCCYSGCRDYSWGQDTLI